jgi:hypothetical protein
MFGMPDEVSEDFCGACDGDADGFEQGGHGGGLDAVGDFEGGELGVLDHG